MTSIGDTCLDAFKNTHSWAAAGVEFSREIGEFYKERAQIEKEAAQRLRTLASKYHAKKASVSAGVSVGSAPQTTPGSLVNNSVAVWTAVLNASEAAADAREAFSSELSKTVAGGLDDLRQGFESALKQFVKTKEKLDDLREAQQKAVRKAKSHYDSSCENMESARAKNKRSLDSKERDMYCAKNSYLIALSVANVLKDRYLHEEIPELLDTLELCVRARTLQTNRLVRTALDGEIRTLQQIESGAQECSQLVEGNNPDLDVRMFIEHNANVQHFPGLPDFLFEPSPIWHEQGVMHVSTDASTHFLAKKLQESTNDVAKATQKSEKALQQFKQAREALKSEDLGAISCSDAVSYVKRAESSFEQFALAESQRVQAEAESATIESATAGIDLGVTGARPKRKLKSLFTRSISGMQHGGFGSQQQGNASVLYDFQAGTPQELSVSAGSRGDLLRADDGSGWVLLRVGANQGLVPAAYVRAEQQAAPASAGATVLYDFEAGGSSQMTVRAGEVVNVLSPDNGGWTQCEAGGRSGLVPTAYLRL